MTLLELKTEVASRLNLSSTEALARIASYINQRYRRVTSTLGLTNVRRTTSTAATVIGNPSVTFTLEKINMLYCLVSGKRNMIYEIPYEDYVVTSTISPQSATPRNYAVKSVTSTTVTVVLYPTPNAIITLTADGIVNASTLADGDTPGIPTDFQDVLVLGAMSDELFKMEKYDLSAAKQKEYEDRVSDLRMFLAKSAMITQTEADNPGGLLTVPRKRWQA